MSPEEQGLYVDVTAWLMRENLHAFRGNQRHLLLIGFHRRMASSLEALATSLRRVAQRLRDRLEHRGYTVSDDGTQLLRDFSDDLEGHLTPESKEDIDDGSPVASAEGHGPVPESDESLRAELQIVEEFAARAAGLGHDSKAQRLLDALRIVRERGEKGTGGGKAVIFTESLTTQSYLRKLLLEHGHDTDDVTLFCGGNETPDADRALTRWESEVGSAIPAGHRPSREIAIRLALVHEFAQRSKVFISTEAGAKGLNLQFCDTVINYDLPWNPQRIEQRIGRVHRYGQKRGVTVVSFLAAGNDAQRLTLEIITQKLDLFGKVLDASDSVLYEPSHAAPESLVASVSVDFEKELWSIYSRARSVDDVTADLRHLRSTMEERRREFDEEQDRASGLVESRLDDAVRQVFAKYQSELPAQLEGLDRDVDAITSAFLDGAGIPHSRAQLAGRVEYQIQPSTLMPEGYRDGLFAIIGDSRDIREGEVLHLGHPIVQAAIEEARRATAAPFRVIFGPIDGTASDDLRQLVGLRGRLVVTKTSYRGIEPVDNLLTTGILEGDADSLALSLVGRLVQLPVQHSGSPPMGAASQQLQDAIEEAVVADQAAVSSLEQTRFQQMLRQLDHYLADQILLMRRKRAVLDARIEELEKRREKSLSPQIGQETTRQVEKLNKEVKEIDRQIDRLEEGGDEEYRAWRERLFARRFQKPEIVRVLDVQFEVAGSDAGC